MTEREKSLYSALQSIANLIPYPEFTNLNLEEVNGINDGRMRGIIAKSAIDIARKTLADFVVNHDTKS